MGRDYPHHRHLWGDVFAGRLLVRLITVVTGLLLGKWSAITISTISCLASLAMVILNNELQFIHIFPFPARSGWVALSLGLLMVSLTLIATLTSLNNALASARQQIKERRAAEESLKQVLDFSPVALVVTDPDNKILSLNKKFTELFGYIAGELANADDWFRLAYPDQTTRETTVRDSFLSVAAYLKTGEFQPMETEVTCKNGSVKPVEFNFSAIGSFYIVSFLDLTERRQAEKQIRDAQQLYESIFRLSPEVMVTTKLTAATWQLTAPTNGSRVTARMKSSVTGWPSLMCIMSARTGRG